METLATPASDRRRQPPATTCRDRDLLRYVGRHGAVSIEHVMAALGVGRTAAYRRVQACAERGLLERLDLLRREPSLLVATPAGLRYAGLGLPAAVVSPGSVDHWLRCASVALALGEEYGHGHILTERELRAAERIEGKPIASAKLGELPSGHPRMHRPDLVVLPAQMAVSSVASDWGCAGPSRPRTQGGQRRERTEVRDQAARTEDAEMRSARRAGQPIAIEVELTPKAPRRLAQIIRAWRRASWVAEVRYLCEPGATRRAVERAIAKGRAEGRVHAEEVVPR